MLVLQNISYLHHDKELLFHDINLTVNTKEKNGLIGNNGSGKSTLLRIIAGELAKYDQLLPGTLSYDSHPFYIPQVFGQFNHLTVAQALKVNQKMQALNSWELKDISLEQKMDKLSGGEQMRLMLCCLTIDSQSPDIIV